MLRAKSRITAILVCGLIFAIWMFASVEEFFASMIPFFNRRKKSEYPERIIYFSDDCDDYPMQDASLTKEPRHHSILPRIIDSKIVTRNVNARYIGRKPMINRPVARKTPPEGGFFIARRYMLDEISVKAI